MWLFRLYFLSKLLWFVSKLPENFSKTLKRGGKGSMLYNKLSWFVSDVRKISQTWKKFYDQRTFQNFHSELMISFPGHAV